MSPKTQTEDDFQLLKDEPLSASAIDKFGYKEIAEGITKLILKSEPPTTIGLYGQWGVGKSSICELITRDIEQNHKGTYEVFYFDTWKYERDSLRRQFLIELDQEVFKGVFNYREVLNQALTRPYTFSVWENIKENFRVWIAKSSLYFLLLLALVIIFIIVNYARYDDEATNLFLSTVFRWSFGAVIATHLVNLMLASVRVFEGTKEIPRTDSAEGFEYFYSQSLEKLGRKKLLVIIDNLDRVEHSKAVSLLSDIKTFLAGNSKHLKNNSIFLIPCDSVAIHAQLKAVYKEIDPEEFLRKFFSFSVKVPKFENLELDQYILEKLQETKIPEFNNPNLAFVASRGFRNSPREIIQFVNSLVALYQIAKKRGVDFVLTEENFPFLAKVLILRLKWPDRYADIEEKLLRSSLPFNQVISEVISENKTEDKACVGLEKFHDATDIKPSNERKVSVFFSLKDIQEKDLPEWGSFIYSAEDKDLTNVGSVIKTLSTSADDEQLKKLANIIYSDYLPKNKDNHQKLRNVISSLLIELPFEKWSLFNKVIEGALTSIRDRMGEFLNEVGFFSIEDGDYDKISHKNKRELIRISLRSLEELDGKETEFDNTVKHYSQTLIFLLRNKSLLLTDDIKFITRLLKSLFIKLDPRTILPDQTNIMEKLEWFKVLLTTEPFSAPSTPENLRQLFYILQHPPVIGFEEALKKALEITLGSVEFTKLSVLPTEDTALSIVRQFVSQICALGNTIIAGQSSETKLLLAQIALSMLGWTKDLPQRGELINLVARVLSDQNVLAEEIVSEIGEEAIYAFNDMHRVDWLIKRSKYKYDLLKLLPRMELSEDQVSEIVNDLVNNNYSDFLEFLSVNKNKIQETYQGNSTFKENIQQNMVSHLTGVNLQEAEKTLKALMGMELSTQIINNLYNSLLTLSGRGEDFKGLVKKVLKTKKNLEIFNAEQRQALSDL